MRNPRYLTLIAALAIAAPLGATWAQSQPGSVQYPSGPGNVPSGAILIPKADGSTHAGLPLMVPPSAADPLVTKGVPAPTTGTGGYSAATVGTTDGTIGSAPTLFLDIVNVSNTATVCLNLGATATIAGTQCAAGEIALSPGWHRSWEGSFVPSDTVHAIASAAGTQVAVGVK